MDFLEKDLEQIIYESNFETLYQKGLIVLGKRKRQFRIGNYGIADLVTFKKKYYCIPSNHCSSGYRYMPYLEITVYELKKDKIGISAFLQAVGYCKGLARYFEEIQKERIPFTLKIVLVGRNIDDSGNFIFITDLIKQYEFIPDGRITDVSFYTYDYGIDGLKFNKKSDYRLTNEGLK